MTKAVNAKVEYFQNLKAKMNGRIKIEGVGFVYSLVEDVLGNFEHFKKNELKSENAGYDIIENADGDWMSFLGDRVEVNLASGETFNVWIDAIAYNAETNDIGFLGFMRDSALSAGRQDKVEFWTSVIEYKLKDNKNADTWRKFLGIEINANSEKSNAEIIACIDDYAVDADAAAEVEIENAKNAAAKVNTKIADLRAAEKIISEKYLSLCRSLYVENDGEYHSAIGFDDYATKYADTFYYKDGDNYVEDTNAYFELKAIEAEWSALFKELDYLENIDEKANILKSKIAEQKSRPHKKIIDWSGTFAEMKISEILSLQKDFKKYLKLGQIELAENIFSMLKTLCKNYRGVAA